MSAIQVELTSLCNARCVMCSHGDLTRKNVLMDPGLFHEVVDQAVALGAGMLFPYGVGESTMHPAFAECMYQVRKEHPDLRIRLYSNGSKLVKEGIRRAIVDCVDDVLISIESHDAEIETQIRPGLNHDEVLEGVRALWRDGKDTTHISVIRTNMEINRHDEEDFRRFFSDLAHEVCVRRAEREFPTFRIKGSGEVKPRLCKRIFDRCEVYATGLVSACCADNFGELIVGDLNRQSLAEVWFGEAFVALRREHLNGDFRYPCDGCNVQ